MIIEKYTTYNCTLTDEERNTLKDATNIVSDLLKNMEEAKCTYVDCTEYLDCPEEISFDRLKSIKFALCQLQKLSEIR